MSFLYDVPGPRTRRRIRIASVLSALLITAVVAGGVWQFASHDQFAAQKWSPFTQWGVWQYLLNGLMGTIESAAIVAVLASVLGGLLAQGRLSRIRAIRWPCTAYIEVARTVPVLLLIYLMLFGLPQLGINVPTLWKMVIPLTFVTSAVFAEILRAGILSLPAGQAESAASLGLSSAQAMRYVIMPQALRNIAPSLITQFVSLLKDTTLGYIVAYTELLYRGQLLTSALNDLIPVYIVVALMYLTVSGSLTGLASYVQRRVPRRSAAPSSPIQALPTIPILEHKDGDHR